MDYSDLKIQSNKFEPNFADRDRKGELVPVQLNQRAAYERFNLTPYLPTLCLAVSSLPSF